MSIFAVFADLRKQDLDSIKSHYDALVAAENAGSEERQERLRQLIAADRAETKAKVEMLELLRKQAIEFAEQRYAVPEQQEAANETGVIITGSAHNASNS